MNTAILALVLATAATESQASHQPEFAQNFASYEVASTEIAKASQTGTLLLSQGDCLAVRAYTNSPYTHVATIVFDESGRPFVYDSMNGPGVRKLPLKDYLENQAPDEVQLFHPCRRFTELEQNTFQNHLDAQLGRPYSVKHHITGKRVEGLHCSEYITDALVEIDWLKVKNPPSVSPASLVKGITAHHIYQTGSTLGLPVILEPVPEPEGRCAQLWVETKYCTARCCSQLSRWFLCR